MDIAEKAFGTLQKSYHALWRGLSSTENGADSALMQES